MTFDRNPFLLGPSFLHWLVVFGSFAGIVFSLAILGALGVYGASGPVAVMARVWQGLHDFLGLSARRIWAIASLTIKEAVRRKALLVFIVFAALMMFASWFLETDLRADLQMRNAVSFTLTTVSWLTIPVVLLLSCWGIPEDIRLRSIHTVVTKPIRRNEIVMGRILGFSVVASLIVALMGAVGFFWVQRQRPKPFAVLEADGKMTKLENSAEISTADRKLTEIDSSRLTGVELKNFETAKKSLEEKGKKWRLFLASFEFVCRVPVYGTLSFLDREGQPADKGINTGDIWEFRSYIEGATKAEAIYKFPMDRPVDRVKLESRFEAFRTHKGRIGQSLLVRYVLVNPTKQLRVPLPTFEVAEFGLNERDLERQISYYDEDQKDRTVDLFDDIVDQQSLTVVVQCMDSGQYLGMARPDMFIRLPDRHFAVGYFKAVLGVLLMSVFLISIGVTASTFVKGPVATLLTFTVLIIGQGFREFMLKLITGEQKGGGPLESWYRLITHMNDTSNLPDNIGMKLITGIDNVMFGGLWLIQHVIPDLSYFVMSPYVANGFDVPWSSALSYSLAMTLGYLLPCILIGYYSLTLRELEAK